MEGKQKFAGVIKPSASHRGTTPWPTILQLVFSILGSMVLIGLAGLFIILGSFARFGNAPTQIETPLYFLLAASNGVLGILMLPSAWTAFLRLAGKPRLKPRSSFPRIVIILSGVLIPIILIAGHWVSAAESFSWFLLPPLHVLAIGLPILVVMMIVLSGIEHGTAQRSWGLLAVSFTLTPLLIFILEIIFLFVLALAWGVWISFRPELLQELSILVSQLEADPQASLQLLIPYITRPGVMFSTLAIGSLLIPAIEELLKPLGLWLLSYRRLTPSEGFAAGAICGAGYAIAESLAIASNTENWAVLVTARIGTGLMHILASALVGWGIAGARTNRQFFRLALTYTAAVALHATWNAVSLLQAAGELIRLGAIDTGPRALETIRIVTPYALVGLTLLAFVGLLSMNHRLKEPTNKIDLVV